MGRTPKTQYEKDDVMKCQTQARNITTNQRVKVNFYPPDFSTTKITTLEYHVYDFTESRYDMVLGRYLL